MSRLVRAVVALIIVLIVGCSDSGPSGAETSTPIIETETSVAVSDVQDPTSAAEGMDQTDKEDANIEVASGASPGAVFAPIQGMTAEETAEWTARVAEAGSLWRALARCESRFTDPIPQGGTSDHAWQAALPFLSSQVTRDCIITTVAGG